MVGQLALPPIGVGGMMRGYGPIRVVGAHWGWGQPGEGAVGGIDRLAPLLDQASSLAAVGIIATGHYGCYDVIVTGFLYI